MAFKFKLKAPVEITISGERGVVVARSEDLRFGKQYRVEYKDAAGRASDSWFNGDQIHSIETE